MSLFGADWTLAALKYLAESGVASATFFETTGWRGVMECSRGCLLPDKFPSKPGMVFPLYHVLADAAEFTQAEVLPSLSSHPLAFDGLALRKNGILRVMLANLTEQRRDILLCGLPPEAVVRTLDEGSYEHATMIDPIAFREAPGEPWPTRDGTLTIQLRPYSYVRIDCH
jgi:D-apionolactonase